MWFKKKEEIISWKDNSADKHKHDISVEGYGELITADSRRLIIKLKKCKYCNSIQVINIGEDLPLPEVPLMRFESPDKGSTLNHAVLVACRDKSITRR